MIPSFNARVAAVAMASVLAAACSNSAHAVTLKQLQNQLDRSKVAAGSVPGHPGQMITTRQQNRAIRHNTHDFLQGQIKRPPPANVTIHKVPADGGPVRGGGIIDHPEEGLQGS
jgi:hypothetical protein